MSKDITEIKHQNIADDTKGVQVQVAPLDKVLDAVATTKPQNFNLHQVFDKDDQEEVDDELFGRMFDEALEYEMSDELIQRNEFLSTRYAHAINDRNGCASLRKKAQTLNLAVSRSTPRRISFYVRGTPKIGNTFVHFSRTKKDQSAWVVTGDVKTILEKWETQDPILKTSTKSGVRVRAQNAIWNSKSLVFLRKVLTTTSLTHRQIAEMLNIPTNGYRAANSRPFTAKDVGNKVRNLFPRELDVHQLMWTLQTLSNEKGWETLRYSPEYCPTTNGLTLKCLVVTMPHADRLVELFGHVIHTDCTFGVLIYAQQVNREL